MKCVSCLFLYFFLQTVCKNEQAAQKYEQTVQKYEQTAHKYEQTLRKYELVKIGSEEVSCDQLWNREH